MYLNGNLDEWRTDPMSDEIDVASTVALMRAASADAWVMNDEAEGQPVILVRRLTEDGVTLRVTRDHSPALEEDVRFIAHAGQDVNYLVARLRDGRRGPMARIEEIETRCRLASPGPWRAFLESDGGIGGSSVIQVSESDGEPDMYLWLDDAPAPDAYFGFVASVRQDLQRLLDAAGRIPG
ncbi:MAG TPA: hypothetical protein VGL39_28485 [Jatrophihabitantaceae bacterium]|jgi:hypothetical protein